MSYDLEIWSVRPFDKKFLGRDTISGKDWQVVFNSSDKILPEDVAEEISALVPGITNFTEINLEGNATKPLIKLLKTIAQEIARQMHGVVLDPQSDRVTTPSGVTRFVPSKSKKKISVLNFSWWFLNDVVSTEKGIVSFLDRLQRLLPEAMPRRYGDCGPEHTFAKTGVKHLARAIKRNLDSVLVWNPRRPVTNVDISCPKPFGPSPKGFRANHVEIQVECSALDQPGWREQLEHFWRQMTFFLQPIYGEVRSEGGYVFTGNTIWATPELIRNTYPYTTRSYFWRGIPRKLGHAVVLGKTYQRLWPRFVKKATLEKGFAFASTPDWSDAVDLVKVVGAAPKAITLLSGEGLGRKQKYPRTWPFDPPFLPD